MIEKIFYNIINKKQARPLETLALSAGETELIEEARKKIDRVFGRSVRIRQVDAGSCNACEWECTALINPVYDVQRFGVDFVASPRHADILLVTGPASFSMALALKKTYLAMPEPKIVIACGDCAADGGVFKGSYAVTGGVDKVVPAVSRIRGCPPSPSAIMTGIMETIRKLF
ncbi:MAG: NADH-quinone oxidoreductase subunit NuoB [Nitrospiraceae bacterium]|nr:NADH-quinone oxidoreductase subunit NuoB [Nitrospiraceae bacterium]